MGTSAMVLTLVAFAASLAVGVLAQDVQITTTVNKTYCITGSNFGDFYHYGAAFAAKGQKASAIQYEGTNVTCCQFELAYDNVTIEEVSKNAQPTPCSSLAQCEASKDCDENATCVMSSEGSFICQCTELYEGDGFSCSRKPHWSEWGAFGPYSKSCGEGATRTRTRTCSKPPRCEGSNTDSETVDLEACPIPTTTTLPGLWSKKMFITERSYGSGQSEFKGWFMVDLLNIPNAENIGNAPSGLVAVPMSITDGQLTEEAAVVAGMVGYNYYPGEKYPILE